MNSAQGGTETTGRLRVGVAGIGYWGSKHVRTMRSLDSVSQVVVIDPSEERVAKLRHSFPEVDSYPDLESALPAIDALVVATPPEHARAPGAVPRSKPGSTCWSRSRWPPSVRDAHRDGADGGASAAWSLMVGHTFEYHAAVWALRDMVARGDLGDLYYLDTARLNLGLYQHDVNVLFDLAPHDISILNYVLGSTPTSVECWGSRHAHRRLEDIAYLRVCYDEPACRGQRPCELARPVQGPPGDGRRQLQDGGLRRPRGRGADPRPRQGRERARRLGRPDHAPDVLPVRRRGRALPGGQRAAPAGGRALRRLRPHRHAPAHRRRERSRRRGGARGGPAVDEGAPRGLHRGGQAKPARRRRASARHGRAGPAGSAV